MNFMNPQMYDGLFLLSDGLVTDRSQHQLGHHPGDDASVEAYTL